MLYIAPARAPIRKQYAVSLSHLMLTTALVGAINIGGTQVYAQQAGSGGIFVENHQGVDYTNESEVSTTDLGAIGIHLLSGDFSISESQEAIAGGNISLTNTVSGNVSTSGTDAFAIEARAASGNVSIVNSATISTTGLNASAIHGFSGYDRDSEFEASFVGGDVSITNSGTVTTEEYFAYGIVANSIGGEVTINNSGTVSTMGDDSWGLEITSGSDRSDPDTVVQTGDDISVLNSGSISTTGRGSYGIWMWTYGGDIQADLSADSNVSTTGNDSHGITTHSGDFFRDGEHAPVAGGDITANIAGTVSTEGQNSNAVDLTTSGGDITLVSEADLSTSADDSRAIYLSTGDPSTPNGQAPVVGGTITATNLGNISTSGQGSIGIEAVSHGGEVSVTNHGKINSGIFAMASDGVEINNTGDIMVAEEAIYVIGNSPVTISNSGTIRVTGDFGDHAVIANSGHYSSGTLGQAVSVDNSGTIDLTDAGDYRRAVRAWSNGGPVTITNSGSVITTADGARGLHALSGSDGYCNFDEDGNCLRAPLQTGGAVTINSSGSVTTAGNDARAITGYSYGGAVNIDTSDTVTTVGDHSDAIRGNSGSTGSNNMTTAGPGGTVTINNAAKVQTAGMFSHGIHGFSNGGTINVTNSGAVTITGYDSHGVSLRSGNNWIGDDSEASEGGTVTLTNNVGGNVSTGGDNSFAINASSSTGNVTVVNRANLSTTGIHSRGINGASGSNRENDYQVPFVGGNVAITNSGTISTQGFDSHAIEGWSNGGMVTVSNSGTVSTSGFDSVGLGIFSGTNRTEDDRVVTKGGNVTGTNSGTVSTTGNFSRAIELWTYGGDIQADLTASSNVSTTGDDSHGLSAYTGNTRTEGGRVPLAGGDITANLAGSISTEGRDSWALDIATPGGDITFMSKATLSTGGENARAINLSSGDERLADGRVPAAGGTITATNLGNLSTLGENSNGFMAYSHGGPIVATNAGKIITSGLHSRGIDLRSGNDWIANGDEPRRGGNVVLTNNVGGDISTSGDSSNAMQAASTTGNIVVSNSAVISTIGDESHGVAGFGGSNRDNDNQVVFVGGSVSVANSGSVTTKGLDSNGMEGWSNGGAVTANNSGTISTAGADSVGMAAYSGTNRTLNGRVVQTGSSVALSNSGSVSTSGNNSNGVEAFSYGGAVRVNLASSSVISTTGDNSHAVGAYSGDSRTTGERVPRAGGTIVVNLNGQISTSGAHSDGVSTGSNGGNVTVTNNAAITASGSSSEGLYVASGSLGETGQVAHNGGIVTINNKSRVAVSGVDSSAIRTYSPNGTVNINNTGVLSSAKGKSIVVAAAARTAITNSGSLQSGATLNSGADTLTNTGTLKGNFDFSSGNDTLHLNAGSAHGDASFDGGAGIDTANLNNAGALTGTFKNFETSNLASGSWTLSNSWGSFNTLNTSNGSQLILNNGILGAAQLNLVAGSTLSGSGTISGGLTNNGSILLSSSDTLKVQGDLHSSAGSKVDFSLGGATGATHSKIEVTGGQFTFDNSEVLNISVDANTDLQGSSRYKVATADGGVDDLSTANDSTAVELTDNSAAFSFDRTIEGNALWVEARSTISDAVSQLAPNLANEAGVIEEFIVESGAGGELAAQMNGLNEQELVVAVRELTAPNEAAGAQALTSIVNTANSIVNTRISGRVSGGRRGFNIGGRTAQARNSYSAEAGETEASRVVMAYGAEGITGSRWLDENGYTQAWVQAFWGASGIDDSDSNQYGTAVGLDFRPNDSILLGGTFSYSRTDSDAPNSNLEADSYGGMLYGAKSFDTGLSLSGVVGYFHAQNDTRRDAFGSTYLGDYDTNTFTLSGNIAQEIEMASWLFTPNAGVRYAHASFDTYTETNGPAPQTISRNDMDSIELSAQASFARSFDVSGTQQGLFEIHAGALYEVGDSDSTVSYRFSPTGSVLTSNAGVPRLKFNVGTVIDVALTDRISTEFGYEGTFASDYSDHLLRAKFKVKF